MSKPVGNPVENDRDALMSNLVARQMLQYETTIYSLRRERNFWLLLAGGAITLSLFSICMIREPPVQQVAQQSSVAWVVTSITPKQTGGVWHAMKYNGGTYYRREVSRDDGSKSYTWFDGRMEVLNYSSPLGVDYQNCERKFIKHNEEIARLKLLEAVDEATPD